MVDQVLLREIGFTFHAAKNVCGYYEYGLNVGMYIVII